MMKNNPLKKLSTTPADTKTQNHFVEERGCISPPAEISCGADNSGAEIREKLTTAKMPTDKQNEIGK